MSLLPLVDPDVGLSVANSLMPGCECDNIQAWKQELRKIKKTNPVIAEWIGKWTKHVRGKNSKLSSLICGIVVYKLLESQAESDQMTAEIRI